MSIALIIIGLVITVLVYRHRLRKTRELLARALAERDAAGRAYVQTAPMNGANSDARR